MTKRELNLVPNYRELNCNLHNYMYICMSKLNTHQILEFFLPNMATIYNMNNLTVFLHKPIRFSSPCEGFAPGCDYYAPLSEEKFVTAVTEVVPRFA